MSKKLHICFKMTPKITVYHRDSDPLCTNCLMSELTIYKRTVNQYFDELYPKYFLSDIVD